MDRRNSFPCRRVMPDRASPGSRTADRQDLQDRIARSVIRTHTRGRIDVEELRTGLRDLGWVEGKNLTIEIRWAGVDPQRQSQLAAELKALPVALILALARLLYARRVTALPACLCHDQRGGPGGGEVRSQPGPAGRRPDRHFGGGRRGSFQASGTAVGCRTATQADQRADEPRQSRQRILLRRDVVARKTLGRPPRSHRRRGRRRTGRGHCARQRGALVVVTDPMFFPRRVHIVGQTLRSGVPSSFGGHEYVAAGGLMSYISSNAWHWRSAAGFVDKILKGAKPANIPVEQPTKFELASISGPQRRSALPFRNRWCSVRTR